MKAKFAALGLVVISIAWWSCENKSVQKSPVVEKTPALKEVAVTEIEPDDELLRAENEFILGDFQECAGHLKEAAGTMRQIAASLKDKHKDKIERSASGIDMLAERVANNKIDNLKSLNLVIGKAGQALAGYRLKLTEKEYFTVSEMQAGVTLKRTIEQLEKSVISHHRALDAREKSILDNAINVAARLQKGEKLTTEDLKATLQSVDYEIEKWENELANTNG